jgi:hypothetical protein
MNMTATIKSVDLYVGTRVRVYRNLRNNKLSVMCKYTRRVLGHVDMIELVRARFIVSPTGVERIRATKRKRVVAFVEGTTHNFEGLHAMQQRVQFNPYRWDTFVDADGRAVQIADEIVVNSSGWMWANGLR